MNWYSAFLAAIFLLWITAVPRERSALFVVLLATIGSAAFTELVTRRIDAPWKLVFPAGIETATILALLKWAPGRSGILQVIALVIAWATHLLCYVDIITGANMVYSSYERILGCIAMLQIALFHATIVRNLRWMVDSINAGYGALHVAGRLNRVLRHARSGKLQPLP